MFAFEAKTRLHAALCKVDSHTHAHSHTHTYKYAASAQCHTDTYTHTLTWLVHVHAYSLTYTTRVTLGHNYGLSFLTLPSIVKLSMIMVHLL